ncbi:MAG: uridine kinase [Pseudohongiellaceae bacterium]
MAACIIAITGASGSGKTYLTDALHEALNRRGTELSVIREDSYYRDQTDLPMSARLTTNYDHPDSLEHELLAEHLRLLKAGQSVDVPEYDYTVHNRKPETSLVPTGRLVLVEGILLLSNPELRKQFDATLFVETPLEVCFARRLARDTVERGRTEQSVVEQFEETVKPMYHKFIQPNKRHAQFLVSGEQQQEAMMEELFGHLNSIIAQFSSTAATL